MAWEHVSSLQISTPDRYLPSAEAVGSRAQYSTIRSILRNEKYMGDVLLQKTYTSDFLSKKKVRNLGELPQYYVENDWSAAWLNKMNF